MYLLVISDLHDEGGWRWEFVHLAVLLKDRSMWSRFPPLNLVLSSRFFFFPNLGHAETLVKFSVRSAASWFYTGSCSLLHNEFHWGRRGLCTLLFFYGEKLCRQNLVVSKDVCFDWQSVCLVCEAGMLDREVRPKGVLSPKWEQAKKLADGWKDGLHTLSEKWVCLLPEESFEECVLTCLVTSLGFRGRAWGQSSKTQSSRSSFGSCNWVFPSPNRSTGLPQPCPSGLTCVSPSAFSSAQQRLFNIFSEIQHLV